MASTEQVRYPNQKQIEIRKVEIKEGDYYLRVRKDALRRAAQTLDAGPFKLYIYLADNMPNYKLNLSPKAVENCFGMKLKQYRNAVEKLIENGYLYQPDPSKEN